MTLISKRSNEYKQKQWIENFLERAIKGEQAYIEIVKPMLLEAARYAKKEIDIFKVNRKYLQECLWLKDFAYIKEIDEDNLMLQRVLNFFKSLEVD